MNRRTILRTLLSHWARRPFQLLTLILGLAAATALWIGVQAINAEAKSSYAQAARLLGGARLATIVAADGGKFDQRLWAALRRLGWPVSPVLEGSLRIDGERVRLIGVDPLSLPSLAAFELPEGVTGNLREFIAPPFLGLAAPETAARYTGLGDLPPLRTVAMVEGVIITDIGVAQGLLNAPGKLSRLIVHPGFAVPDAAALAAATGGALRTLPPRAKSDLQRLTDSLHLNLSAFGFLSFFVGLFIVHAQTSLAFEQRKPMFRTLRACGVPARTLAAVLAGELVLLALGAGILGTLSGYALASALLPDVAASLHGLFGASVPDQLTLSPFWWLIGLGISVLGALVAAGAGVLRVARLPVLDTARPRAWLMSHERTIRGQLVLAAVCLAAAVALLVFGTGLLAGFALLGLVLFGSALSLPGLLAFVLAWLERRARTATGQWFWADTRQQLGGLSLALMALFLALSINIGVGSMVSSFRETFLGWLDQRLTAELYVAASSDEQGEKLAAWLVPRSDAVLPIWNAETRIGNWPSDVYGFRDDPSYRDKWPILSALPGAWDSVAKGESVFLSEQLARRLGAKPGGAVTIPTARGDWQVRIAGIYSDYGNASGQVLVSLDALLSRWPDVEKQRFGVRMDAALVPGLITQLRDEFGLDASQMTDQADLKAGARQVFERTFAVTAALSTLTLGVAGVALLSSLLALAMMRLPQLAPLWAMGVTRRQLGWMEFRRALYLAGLTTLAALPVGLVIAWVLSNVINVEAFGWRLPVRFYPVGWLQLGLLALLTAAVAAIFPALRLLRTPPSRLLQVFTHER